MQFSYLYDLFHILFIIIIILGVFLPRKLLPYYMILITILFFNYLYKNNRLFIRDNKYDPLFYHLIDLATGVKLNRDQYEKITDWILVGLFVIALARYNEFISGSLIINKKYNFYY